MRRTGNNGNIVWDKDTVKFTRNISKASCDISSIQSFTHGGFSSRFWLLRKHINSMLPKDLSDLPFYCWECLTIRTDSRDINLVIKDEKDMKYLLEFLIVAL